MNLKKIKISMIYIILNVRIVALKMTEIAMNKRLKPRKRRFRNSTQNLPSSKINAMKLLSKKQ
jgi:hypothetical protein